MSWRYSLLKSKNKPFLQCPKYFIPYIKNKCETKQGFKNAKPVTRICRSCTNRHDKRIKFPIEITKEMYVKHTKTTKKAILDGLQTFSARHNESNQPAKNEINFGSRGWSYENLQVNFRRSSAKFACKIQIFQVKKVSTEVITTSEAVAGKLNAPHLAPM